MSKFAKANDREASYKPERLSNWSSQSQTKSPAKDTCKSPPPKAFEPPIVDANGHLIVRKKAGRTAFNLDDEMTGAFCSNMRWPQENTTINAKGGVKIKNTSQHRECHGG